MGHYFLDTQYLENAVSMVGIDKSEWVVKQAYRVPKLSDVYRERKREMVCVNDFANKC